MQKVKLTEDEFNILKRTEYSLDALYEWLEQCVEESDSELKTIIQEKISLLIDKLNNLLNK